MKFRQVHLDFHTSEKIEDIGKTFSKEQFQKALKLGHVDSITVFSKCHHGWAYHPSTVNEMHPNLKFDLLKSQIEAAHEIGVKTPVYLSAGLDQKLARRHPEWLVRNKDESTTWIKNFMEPGFHLFCMNTPYLDVLISHIEEVVENYDADGIFLDIVGEKACYCQSCVKSRLELGMDPYDENDADVHKISVYANYTTRVNNAIHNIKPDMPIFHNGGHILRGRRELMKMDTHIEMESLPTGGWGYDHFPMSVRYVQPVCNELNIDFLGMTGKFHTSWGEFGGFKHPNALIYETALDIANGAKCSIGDQLHPLGQMDEATYKLIGEAYSMVEKKEQWCDNVKNIADIGLFSQECIQAPKRSEGAVGGKIGSGDTGAVRMMLEGKYLFDVIDLEFDFNKYKVIILPDNIFVNEKLKSKLKNYSGKILASGTSGLDANNEFAVDLGAKYIGENEYNPTYLSPDFELKSVAPSQYIIYSAAQKVEENGNVLGRLYNPYFNRTTFNFCSHKHAPANLNDKQAGITQGEKGIYMCWDIFEDYAKSGSLAVKETVIHCLDMLLGEAKTLETTLSAQGVNTIMEQSSQNRYVHHLLYATPTKRGSGVEIIEDINPIFNVKSTVRLPQNINNVYLAPQMEKLCFTQNNGEVEYTVPEVNCHQMVVLEY